MLSKTHANQNEELLSRKVHSAIQSIDFLQLFDCMWCSR